MTHARVPGTEILESGLQASDPGSFFSTLRQGYGCRLERNDGALQIEMEHGSYRVVTRSAAGYSGYEIEVLRESWIFDFAVRWRLPGTLGAEVRIAGELVPLGTPLVHAHPVSAVMLGELTIESIGATELPASLHAEMHVTSTSDTSPSWIVHARAVANDDERLWVKHIDGHSEAFRGGPIERRVLLRRTELTAPGYPYQVRPHARLTAGTKLRVGLTLGVEKRARLSIPPLRGPMRRQR